LPICNQRQRWMIIELKNANPTIHRKQSLLQQLKSFEEQDSYLLQTSTKEKLLVKILQNQLN